MNSLFILKAVGVLPNIYVKIAPRYFKMCGMMDVRNRRALRLWIVMNACLYSSDSERWSAIPDGTSNRNEISERLIQKKLFTKGVPCLFMALLN